MEIEVTIVEMLPLWTRIRISVVTFFARLLRVPVRVAHGSESVGSTSEESGSNGN